MNIPYAAFALVVLLVSTFLFKKAAGTLSIHKLNVISLIYYNLLIFSFIGIFCMLLGFKDHYIIAKINDNAVILKTSMIVCYVMIALPFCIFTYNKIFLGGNEQLRWKQFINSDVELDDTENSVYNILIFITIICLIAIIYMFLAIGTVPIVKVFLGTADPAIIRRQASIGFVGNIYIRNILILGIFPCISYISYIYMCKTNRYKKRWFRFFVFTFLVTIIVKTYDLEKAPVIYYFFYFYIINIMIDQRKAIKMLILLSFVIPILIFAMYAGMMGYHGNIFTITSGPGGRIFITQVGALCLHIKAFPEIVPFLEGASLPTVVASVFHVSESWVRSGRVVMEIFNPSWITTGVAGVMSSLFVGEAYANWGIFGVIFSPFIVALPFSFTFALLLKQRKTPLSISFYIIISSLFMNAIQGGIVDFLYNVLALMILLFFLGVHIFIHHGRIRVLNKNNLIL